MTVLFNDRHEVQMNQLYAVIERPIDTSCRCFDVGGRVDVGQTVAVKGLAAIAVEAVEGTDECIRRAGTLCPQGGFTVVKVAKPQQDMRFDVPTIGLGTVKTLFEAGGRVLAVEAGKTIIIDEPQVMAFALRHRLTLVAIDQSDVAGQARAA